MKVFISHTSTDKPAVEALARALAERGLEPWYDTWEIGPGDDIVAAMNDGLQKADAGIVVFSANSKDSRWVEAETSYLTYARIKEGKVLIPVVLGDDAYIPPLLRPLARRGIEEFDAIADGLRRRSAGPPPTRAPELGTLYRVRLALGAPPTAPSGHPDEESIDITVTIGDEIFGTIHHGALPTSLTRVHDTYRNAAWHGARLEMAGAQRKSLETAIVDLGRELRAFCLPPDAGEALTQLLDGSPIGATIEVTFETDRPDLAALPFEALRLPDDRLLATHPSVIVVRRPKIAARRTPAPPLAAPLKILVAVGAPDEQYTTAAVLDQEHELQNILDAVEPARVNDNAQVKILEVGSPAEIAAAIESDAYHVLHISCHGLPGALELEDEDGRAVRTTAAELIEPLRATGRPLPMVLLNSCHGAVPDDATQTISFAQSLLAVGVPAVVAMQTSVTDHYAIELARTFYTSLIGNETAAAARSLAAARRELEQARQHALQNSGPLHGTEPEYATATVVLAGEDTPIVDYGLDKVPLKQPPVEAVPGPVPQLRIGDLVGRRKELRECLRTMRDRTGATAGVVLHGIGGVGKSALAGRAMVRLAEDNWIVTAHKGRLDLRAIGQGLHAALIGSTGASAKRLEAVVSNTSSDDVVLLHAIEGVLVDQRISLVLDDFEQNLTLDGSAFHDPDAKELIELLAKAAKRSRLLITCRHPVPGLDAYFQSIPIGPLSPAQTRKLALRLPSMSDLSHEDLTAIIRLIGGHPRVLEFADALVQGGKGRLPHVTTKQRELLADSPASSSTIASRDINAAVQDALALGARDIFLEELLAICRDEGIADALIQVAVSNLPVDPPGLARMLANEDASEAGDVSEAERTMSRLADLSLVYRWPDGSGWVHRWTAEGLKALAPDEYRERSVGAGAYRWWRVENTSHDINDAMEAVRNFLAGEAYDEAAQIASGLLDIFEKWQQSLSLAAFASEILEFIPDSHPEVNFIADREARAHLVLGQIDKAKRRYDLILARHQRLAGGEPERSDYQHTLSVSFERMGDLLRALGQGESARDAYQQSHDISERLAAAEPDRADFQHQLSVSLIKMGDLALALGQADRARDAYQHSLDIATRIAATQPDRVDYQRHLSVSYNKMADLFRSRGQADLARDAYQHSLDIRERLTAAEPNRADYQRDLAVSFERMGDRLRDLGQGARARDTYQHSLDIIERLAAAEPDRADYQRDLSVSYNKMGDLYRALGQADRARDAYQHSLQIAERIAAAEPDRADYQRDLSVSFERMGDIFHDLGHGERAREYYEKDLAIAEHFAAAEPDRADYQHDLSASFQRVGDIFRDLGHGERARGAYQKSLDIIERLAAAEPDRADFQRDLAGSYNKMGDLFRDLGQADRARDSYQQSLDIFERLAAADPDRADYQRTLAVSLSRMGHLDSPPALPLLRRALAILIALRDTGRLLPPDEPWLNSLQTYIDEHGP